MLPPARARTVLVVDDDADLAEALESILIGFIDGIRVVVAHSGQAALEALRREPVDLIVTDYRMPGMDGLQLLEEADRIRARVPRILVTAYEIDLLRGLGRTDATVMRKPLDPQSILEEVARGLAKSAPGKADPSAPDVVSA